ncbi:hypothetical protein GWM83_02940 [Candidatus Bathyarchaeota archaeon]|nr:hypothetical protein [Candidatus Bathyarchaeota archaeon]NIW34501.1 hypothetical protein [Candidatus Bathyarchaeota archaeon]
MAEKWKIDTEEEGVTPVDVKCTYLGERGKAHHVKVLKTGNEEYPAKSQTKHIEVLEEGKKGSSESQQEAGWEGYEYTKFDITQAQYLVETYQLPASAYTELARLHQGWRKGDEEKSEQFNQMLTSLERRKSELETRSSEAVLKKLEEIEKLLKGATQRTLAAEGEE